MDVLIFGNHSIPDISFEVSPNHGLKIQCKNNFVLDYEGVGQSLTWKDLVERTEPSVLLPGSEILNPYPLEYWPRAWSRLTETLITIPQTAGERTFLKNYFQVTESSLVSQKERTVAESSSWPALIPQAWVNWIHYDTKDKERAQRTRREPFRVDFVIFSRDRKIVIEIDGSSHFADILDINPDSGRVQYEPSLNRYTEHLKKDRWLRSRGWEVWRFTELEIEDLKDILVEMDLHQLFW